MEDKKMIWKNTFRSMGIFIVAYLSYKLISPAFRMNDRPKMYRQPTTIKADTVTRNITDILIYDSDSLNKNPSAWGDSIMIFQSAVVLPRKTVQYNYVLKIDTREYNIPDLKKNIEKSLFESFINIPGFKVYKDSSVTVLFNFTDMKMKHIFKIALTPDKYTQIVGNSK